MNRNAAGAVTITEIPCGTNAMIRRVAGRHDTSCRSPAIGYAHACGMCTPAEPKPTPAIDAASIMNPRASTSEPDATARRRYRPPYSSALQDHTSATGFAPWYGGRAAGDAAAGRDEYGSDRYDSAAWQITSSPQAATTEPGNEAANDGSTIACEGRRYRCEIPVLTRKDGTSSTATVVASEPVPHVVGIARCGSNGPGTATPSPTGALT